MKRIVVDSGCDLRELPAQDGLSYCRVPLKILVGEETFTDDLDLDIPRMMDAMAAFSGASRSACPSPQEWVSAFGDADEVYAVTISGEMSGSYSSLCAARDMALEENPSRKILVVDSQQASAGMTLLIQKIAALAAENLSFEEMCEKILAYRDHIRLTFVLYSVDNFVKNGRVSRIAGMASRLLGIHIVCRADGGKLQPKHKCRGVERGYDKMLDEMTLDGYKGGPIVLAHSFNPEGAKRLADLIAQRFKTTVKQIMTTSGLCSFYAEKQGMLIGYEV